MSESRNWRVSLFMGKISRNSPCLCGSGKKYKKCCLQKNEGERTNARRSAEAAASVEQGEYGGARLEHAMFVKDDLDLLSNGIVELIKNNEFGEAETRCAELLNSYPDVVDGYERFAMLYEARGDNTKAIEFYKKTADFMSLNPGYDQKLIQYALDKVKQLSRLA